MRGIFPPLWTEALAALTVLAFLSYIQFRHVALAVLTTLAPLPGLAVAIAFHISPEPVSYLFGFLSGVVLASGIEARVCADKTTKSAVRETIRSVWLLLIWPSVVATALCGLTAAIAGKLVVLEAAGIIVASVASAVALVFVGGRILPYSEDFITRANRVRERRERWLDALAFSAQPRWGWTISGIGLVFAILGYFGGGNGAPAWTISTYLILGAMEALLTVAGFLAARSLRHALAFAVVGAVLICLAASTVKLTASAPVLALATAPTLMLATQSSRFAREGDKAAVAFLRSLERHAVTIVFFSVGSAITLCLFGQLGAAFLVAGGAPAALLLFPALLSVVYMLLPAQISPDAYRLRRSPHAK